VVERGLQKESGYYSTAVLGSPSAQKESERVRLKNEIGILHSSIRKTNNTKNEIKEELVVIRQQVEKKVLTIHK